MKGSLHTDELMAAVVAREGGLRTARRISHCFIMDVPGHADALIITDAAVNIAPTWRTRSTSSRTRSTWRMRWASRKPRVAILSAMETVNPKVPSTHRGRGPVQDGRSRPDHRRRAGWPAGAGQRDQPGGGGDQEASVSPVAGRANVLVVPDLEAGNMLAKSLSFLADADARGHRPGRAGADHPDQPGRRAS